MKIVTLRGDFEGARAVELVNGNGRRMRALLEQGQTPEEVIERLNRGGAVMAASWVDELRPSGGPGFSVYEMTRAILPVRPWEGGRHLHRWEGREAVEDGADYHCSCGARLTRRYSVSETETSAMRSGEYGEVVHLPDGSQETTHIPLATRGLIRRRVEDALRKTATDAQLMRVAEMLNVNR